MSNKLANRVKMTVSGTPGTGAITLNAALSGFQTFAQGGISNNDTVPYVIEDGASWEIGVGTYSSTGPALTRTTVTASSNSGSAINASSNAIVMISPLAADLQSGTAAGNLVELDGSARLPAVDGSLLTNLNIGSASSGTLAVSRGGTGLTSLTAGHIPFGNGTGAFGNSSNLFWDSANGRLGVGTSAPGEKLDVDGMIRSTNTISFIGLADNAQMRLGPLAYQTRMGVSHTTSGGANLWYLQSSSDNYAANFQNLVEYNHPSAFWRFFTNNTERLRITSAGNVGIGVTPGTNSSLSIGNAPTSGVNNFGVNIDYAIQSNATTAATYFRSVGATAAAAFTLPTLRHFYAVQGTIGAGSTVTDQFGFIAENSLTGATNNYGFYSNIASGTGRWNFYANGTAASYFNGTTIHGTAATSISSSSGVSGALQVVGAGSGAINIGRFDNNSVAPAIYFSKSRSSAGTSTTPLVSGDAIGFIAFDGSDGTSQVRGASILASVDGTVTTGGLPTRLTFGTSGSGSGASTERLRIKSDGGIDFGAPGNLRMSITSSGNVGIGTSSPANKLTISGATGSAIYESITNGTNTFLLGLSAGNVPLFGTTSNDPLLIFTNNSERLRIDSSGNVGIGVVPPGGVTLAIGKSITGSANPYGISNYGTVQSDATGTTAYFTTITSTQAASFTAGAIKHYQAFQGTIGAGSTVTNQFGFTAESSLTGATNNFGFYSNIASGTGRWNFYANGTANNAFAGNSRFGGVTAPVATVDVTGSVAATTTIRSSGATSGIGYATGAGGTVTQATSRTTGVTIDKVCGQITLVSAAGSTSWQSFTVTNSAVASTDTIIVNQDTGTDLYQIFVTNVAAGSFQVTFATTGGTTTEQPVFGFSIIKAVAA